MRHHTFLPATALGLIALCLAACSTTKPTAVKLAPGQYDWHPERSASGPVLVVVSIDDQLAYVYRNGVEIARSTVSTGREGKETPTGVFTVLERNVEHESSIYKGAQMPYMQRLTWGGIAMHAGDLPGYPASAGCVRLPLEFSEKIYSVMASGGTVVITKKGSPPSRSSRPADILMASRAASPQNRAIPAPSGEVVWEPSRSQSGPFSILLSYADKTVYVWRNGVRIGQSPIGIAPGANPPEGVFLMLDGVEPRDPAMPGIDIRPWAVLSLDGGDAGGNAVAALRHELSLPDDFRKKVNKILTPGTILLATRESSNSATRSARDFTIMRPEGGE
jgi:hypothetical protein